MKCDLIAFAIVALPFSALSQAYSDTVNLSLKEVISIARERSTAVVKAATLAESQYWQYKTFKANYNPQFNLEGFLPQFSKTNIPVVQPEGTVEFKPVVNDNSQLNLGLTQNIGLTGGQLFLGSNMLRFRDFERGQTRYNGNPLVIGFNQPLFAFNPFSWDKKIEPLRYEESQRRYAEDLESISRGSTELFFNQLLAQINAEIATKNLVNHETLYKIGEVKAKLGRLSKDELLRLKLGYLNARKAVAQAQVNAETSALQLKSFMGFSSLNPLKLLLPETLPKVDIPETQALKEARENRQQSVEFTRSLLEADKEILKAKGEAGLKANLYGSFGLTNAAGDAAGLFRNAKDQQVIRLGFSLPIADWGKGASKVKTAQANKKLVKAGVEQAKLDFDQEIITQVKQLNVIKEQMETNKDADQTAAERFEIAKKRYLLADLSITDLNIALQEKDQARRDYILSLKSFWTSYYNLRVLTLYDFEQGKKLSFLKNMQ
ncbi:TolC family protein [Desertivirga arenae]|uniref:TolC family protein n=1 Tax=Desertivirga arenae TaxID=2810309 RepID=UPI001A97C2E6|nr:TolC family protein [Pedobacter sp. SYSU D00823]